MIDYINGLILKMSNLKIKVFIPTGLQKYTDNNSNVTLDAVDIKTLIRNLEKDYPELKQRILKDTGEVFGFINIFVNKENINILNGINTTLISGDEVTIIQAVAGG